VKIEAIDYGDRRVYSVGAFNRGVASWLARLPTVWVEGEVTELRRQARWASVFFTLKDPAEGTCLGVSMPRGQFDALRLELADGDRVTSTAAPSCSRRAASSGCARSRSSASAWETTSRPSSA
jgi:exonuclease VII large subunit